MIAVNQPTMKSLNWNLTSLSLMMNRIVPALFQHLLSVHKLSIFPKNLQMDLVVWHKSFSFQLLAFRFSLGNLENKLGSNFFVELFSRLLIYSNDGFGSFIKREKSGRVEGAK